MLHGKVAIVTGAAGALGLASVTAMARAGASVVVADINADGAERVADALRAEGHDAVGCVADVADEASVNQMVATAVRQFGGLDVIFNNAGLVGLEHNVQLMDLDVEVWDRTFAVNARGVMLGCKHALPELIKRGGGSIINTSSDAAFVGDLANTAYGSSKAAVITLTRYVAAQYGKQNVRCNAICPGVHFVEDKHTREGFRPAMLDILEEQCMLPRLGNPDDIAKVAVFLASDQSEYITAQTLQVDGGLLHHSPHFADARRMGGGYKEK